MLSKETKLSVGVAVTAIAVFSTMIFSQPSEEISGEAPPSIDLEISDTSRLSGSIGNSCIPDGHNFTAAEEANFTPPNGTEGKLLAGVHIYHSDVDITVQRILDMIEPDDQNRILILAYNPINNPNHKFSIYPTINSDLVLPVPDPRNTPIAANNGFIIASCKEVKMWNIRSEIQPGRGLPSNIGDVEDNWILFSASFDESLDLAPHNITAAYPQNGPNASFPAEGAPLDQIEIGNPYFMVWLRISPRGDDGGGCVSGQVLQEDGTCGPAEPEEPEEPEDCPAGQRWVDRGQTRPSGCVDVEIVIPDFTIELDNQIANINYQDEGIDLEAMPVDTWCVEFEAEEGADATTISTTGTCYLHADINQYPQFIHEYERGGKYFVTMTAFNLNLVAHSRQKSIDVPERVEAFAAPNFDVGINNEELSAKIYYRGDEYGPDIRFMPAIGWCANFNGDIKYDAAPTFRETEGTIVCHSQEEIMTGQPDFNFTYSEPGSYVVTMTGYDTNGSLRTRHKTITISAE